MNILKMMSLKSFFKYSLLTIVFFLCLFQTKVNVMDYNIQARKPSFNYSNAKEFIAALNDCINWIEKDTTKYQNVPREIIIAQAVIESNYGQSRFAKEANNLFGVMTFDLDKPHIKPLKITNPKFGARIYQNKCDSVKHYINTLNTGYAFDNFRETRFQMIKNSNLDVLILAETLKRYATNPGYVDLLKKTIKSLRKKNEGI